EARAQVGAVEVDVEGGVVDRVRIAAPAIMGAGWRGVRGVADLGEPERVAVVADRVLVPARLLDGDGADQVLVDAPLAGAPTDDLVGRAGVVAGDLVAVLDELRPLSLVRV